MDKHVVLKEIQSGEFNGIPFKKMVTSDGTYKVGKKIEKYLPLLPECIGKTITLNMDEFKGKPFVADIILPLPANAPVNAPKAQQPGNHANGDNNKVRVMTLSYAKDLVAAGKIGYTDIYNCAHDLEAYANSEFKPSYQADWMAKYLPKLESKPEAKGKKLDPMAVPQD
jgi:hypothetical protein